MMLWAWMSAALASPDCGALDRSPKALQGPPGSRKIALIVGIGDYEAKPGGKNIDLVGPPNDARRIRDLLIERYGFPVDNICTLIDREATRDAYLRSWREHLGRAVEGDTVVYYFAGHGSQTTDFDGPQDEPDGMDETILLHDSRASVPDFLDDEFNALLGETYAKTTNITVIVDACNSGSAIRSEAFRERQVDPVDRTRPIENPVKGANGDYSPGRYPGVVALTAAQDGTSALERDGQGVFTNALLRSLDAKGDGSWAQIVPILPRWIAAQASLQTATFEGKLEREIFGKAVVDRALSWQVHKINGTHVRFRGPAMPGWGEGAILEVFEDGTARRKARVRLDKASNFRADGTVVGRDKGVSPGDYATLETPGRDAVAIRVAIADGVPNVARLKRALRGDKVLRDTVGIVSGPADFVVRPGRTTDVEIVGGEGVVRNAMNMVGEAGAVAVAETLGMHARQASLLALSAEPNAVYPHDMLELRITRDRFTPESCARSTYTPARGPVPYVQVPMCTPIQLDVTLQRDPAEQLYLGILYLSNDGSIHAWPAAGASITLNRKGEQHIEQLGRATPPLAAADRILVFGSHEPVRWKSLEATALTKERSASPGGSELQRFVLDHVGGTRGIGDEPPDTDGDPAWTSGFVQLQVTGDRALWTQAERSDSNVCYRLVKRGCP